MTGICTYCGIRFDFDGPPGGKQCRYCKKVACPACKQTHFGANRDACIACATDQRATAPKDVY